MKVLVAQESAANQPDDFHWTADGELLGPPRLLCHDPALRYETCRCGYAFTGAASARATSVGVVAEMDAADVRLVAESAWADEDWRDAAISEGQEGEGDDLAESSWAWFEWLAEELSDVEPGTSVRVRHDYADAGAIVTELRIEQ